jgi:tRNA pseudouridine55 synthase
MNGVLPVDKPDGPSSHDVVAAARRALGLRRIGHTGTLDPFASGLLLLCLGPATRLAEYITGLDKTYRATARLGVATDTLDRTGAVVSENGDWEALSESRIRAAFEGQAGTRLQTPPAYSAKKIGGRKAYELARAGEAVTPDPVEVTIHSLEVTAMDGPEIRFEMRASSGTYVRAVARDAGEALGVGAHLTTLRRTAIGDPDAVARALLPPREAVGHLPAVAVDADQRRRIGHGQRLSADGGPTGVVALVHGEELVAMAESDGRTIRPRKVFA